MIDKNTQFMALMGVRYAMGRASYVVGMACDWVRANWELLSDADRERVHREVAEELDRREDNRETLGWDMDHREWSRLRDWMKERL